MFCYQCEQTAKGTGCDVLGVCGKKPEVADLQDLLLYSLMGLSQVVLEGIRFGIEDRRYGEFTVKAAFSTLTNVDFDPERFVDLIRQTVSLREELKKKLETRHHVLHLQEGPATFEPAVTREELLSQAASVGLFSYPADNPDFPGPILMTTNCLQRPGKTYQDHLFTSGMVGWPDIPHIPDADFQLL
jgi:hydroxylamine reductase